MKLIQTNDYLLFIDEKVEIKGTVCLCYNSIKSTWREDIILYQGTMPDYHYRGFQKIKAYYPLNSEAKELDLPLLPNPFKDVDIERLADKWFLINNYNKEDLIHSHTIPNCITNKNLFIEGYKAAQSKQFTLEDMKKAIEMAREDYHIMGYQVLLYSTADEIIQSLSTQQLPSEFIPEYEDVFNKTNSCSILDNNYHTHSKKLKTITNSESKEVLIGTYKY